MPVLRRLLDRASVVGGMADMAEEWTLIVAVPWALSAGVIAASKVLSSE